MERLLPLSILFCFLLISCNTNCITKESFVTSYDKFIDSASEQSLSTSERIKNEELFNTFTTECYEKFQEEMTNSEKLHFWKQTLKYQFRKHEETQLDKILSTNLQDSFERDLEKFSRESQQELITIFKEEVAPDLNNAIDDVVKGIEEIGESLKDWLKEIDSK